MDILKRLQFLKTDIKVCVWDNDIDKIQYHELETFRPTKEQILAVTDEEAENAYNKRNYALLRAEAYPHMSDYLDAVVKGDEQQKQNYINACLEVKQRFPKS